MEYSDIQNGLETFVTRFDSQTYLRSYRETRRDSLLKEGLTTRANSLWKMAEYVVATYDDNESEPIENYISGWKTLASKANNQYLLLEVSHNVWKLYDAQGSELGDEDYIREYFSQKQKEYESDSPSDENKDANPNGLTLEQSRQRIFYGAPGTGKSYNIDNNPEVINVIRTTFHPDSDYSTFVGAYKPTMGKNTNDILSIPELKEKLLELKSKGEIYPCQKFATRYWYSLDNLTSQDIKEILNDCSVGESFHCEIQKGIAVGKDIEYINEDKIVYKFVPQAFLQAYVQAWKFYENEPKFENVKKQYLIIEEINRGNCAQIFGDLFQLLDRNKAGFSDYYINADSDMRSYLAKEFQQLSKSSIPLKDDINNICNKGVKEENKKDFVSKILSGEILLLPNNLYIWATMNTSDQSLFPIDSAFKRRWDWEYVPISQGVDKGEKIEWKIKIGDKEYDWWENFIVKINAKIEEITNSEDKKLGFFFCQANEDKIIDEKTFVNKVLFYLWNDVFKDYGFEGDLFQTEKGGILTFSKFYNEGNGSINTSEVNHWLKTLSGIKESPKTDSNNTSE